jgi:hypothetical protein
MILQSLQNYFEFVKDFKATFHRYRIILAKPFLRDQSTFIDVYDFPIINHIFLLDVYGFFSVCPLLRRFWCWWDLIEANGVNGTIKQKGWKVGLFMLTLSLSPYHSTPSLLILFFHCLFLYINVYIYIYICMYVSKYIYLYVYNWSIHAYGSTYPPPSLPLSLLSFFMFFFLIISLYFPLFLSLNIYVCMYVCMYILCMYVYIYIYIYIEREREERERERVGLFMLMVQHTSQPLSIHFLSSPSLFLSLYSICISLFLTFSLFLSLCFFPHYILQFTSLFLSLSLSV